LCECGEIVDGATFKDYIKTTANPSTPTIGHRKCGLIFDFVDGKMPKRYSSRIELKSLAMMFAKKNEHIIDEPDVFLLQVDRLKSLGILSDMEILVRAYRSVLEARRTGI